MDEFSTSPLPRHHLPAELVHEVFHYGCILSTSFSLALCQLSTWTRKLALPYLFNTVVIRKLGASESFYRSLAEIDLIRPPTVDFDPSNHVQNLWIKAVYNRILRLFSMCDNLVHLALPAVNLFWLVHASSVGQPRISTLSSRSITRKKDLRLFVIDAMEPEWSLSHLVTDDPGLNSPLFSKIIHLRIGRMGSYATHLDLAHFTCLTHIAVSYHQPEIQNLQDLLPIFEFPSTMFLVVVLMRDALTDLQYEDAITWVGNIRRTNSKIYVVPGLQSNMQAEWEAEVRCGLSLWDKAESFTLRSFTS